MAGQVLYRKWRPQRFEEIVGQDHVTRTLQRALTLQRVAHAYLFTGPRGTGKTTTARILAKAVNCTSEGDRPCNTCASCLSFNQNQAIDLIEIDAASNRGIDEIRDLRERVRFAPAQARYKVYVIDEVHMLTTEAFNALLKTLEEPPGHVIFILATTESHRIPATVHSRCQRFDFRRLRVADIVQRLERIVEAEGLQVTRPALEAIARQATGSMRDAESLLDQMLVYGQEQTLDLEQVQAILGMRGSEQVANLAQALIDNDLPVALQLLQGLVDDGVDLRQFNRELVTYLRGLLFLAVTREGSDLLEVTQETRERMRTQTQQAHVGRLTVWLRRFSELDNELKAGWYGQLPLELALVEALMPASVPPSQPTGRSGGKKLRPAGRRQAASSSEAAAPSPAPAAPSAAPASPSTSVEKAPSHSALKLVPSDEREAHSQDNGSAAVAPGELSLAQLLQVWPRVVERIRPLDPSVQALLHDSYCQPIDVDGQIIVLGFRYSFHKSKIEETRNRRIVEHALRKLLRGDYGVRCVLNDASAGGRKRQQASEREQAQQDPRIKAAANIFNARIVEVQSNGETGS
ncbi:MAG: DNA polymerase III subunit gamma/tau [Chloroflexia bacterium]|nr:DNA polymerase III subunit gamma/tau [Chloroflexia bacterium]